MALQEQLASCRARHDGVYAWNSIFLIAVYATELLHAVGDVFRFDPTYLGWALVGGALVAAGAAALAIRPWRHGGFPRRIV